MSDATLALFVLVWVVALSALVIAIGSARQLALLTFNLQRNELGPDQGPELGERLLAISGNLASGGAIQLAAPLLRRTAIVFMRDGCQTCDGLLPDLVRLTTEAQDVDTWVVVDHELEGDEHQLLNDVAEHVIVSEKAFETWEVSAVPYGFVASSDGTIVAKGHLPHVQRLRETLGLASELESGDGVPDVEGALAT